MIIVMVLVTISQAVRVLLIVTISIIVSTTVSPLVK